MTFWQENYAFIKDVYESRSTKLEELMQKTDRAIADVLADKIYTSAEFKKVKETFMGLSRNLEQPDVKDWLSVTKETLMGDKSGKEKDEEAVKLTQTLLRYDTMQARIADTKNIVDVLWKSYQYTDDLAPLMEWLEEIVSKNTREINSNSASQTEEILEKHEKTLDQLDKKKRTVVEQQSKGEKIMSDPKSPKFLSKHIDKLKELWNESNKTGNERLDNLKANLVAWEQYEKERDALIEKLNEADMEFIDARKMYNLAEVDKYHKNHLSIAARMRKDIEQTFANMSSANDILAKLLGDEKKAELAYEVDNLKARLLILNNIDDKLINLADFIVHIKDFDSKLKEMNGWLSTGRKRMDELIKPAAPIAPEDRVVMTMELLTDVRLEKEKMDIAKELWQQLMPTESGEDTPESQDFVNRMDEIYVIQQGLMKEAEDEGAKYGDDVKYLADFTGATKKVEPWLQKSEAKKGAGMTKPKNLGEAEEALKSSKAWKNESDEMINTLNEGYKAAEKMTLHDEADHKYAAFKKRWEVINQAAQEWCNKYQSMVDVWKKQAETAAMVTAAIAAKPSEEGVPAEMKLEDLEKHLEALKQMFIDKQKMMEQLDKANASESASASASGAPAT